LDLGQERRIAPGVLHVDRDGPVDPGQMGVVPDHAVLAEPHVADQDGVRMDECPRGDPRPYTGVAVEGHAVVLSIPR